MQPVTLRRWEIAAAFIALTVIFTLTLTWVQRDTATIHELQRTNCGLRVFLLTAEQARLRAAHHEHGKVRLGDLKAANGYQLLASRFQGRAIGDCPTPGYARK